MQTLASDLVVDHRIPRGVAHVLTAFRVGLHTLLVSSSRSVFVCMLDYGEPVRAKALRSSVLHLGHRFPKVRKTTAEALYLKLLANESIVDEVSAQQPERLA